MPKKVKHKKSAPHKAASRHFLWSVFFVGIAAALNIFFVGQARNNGDSFTWPMVAVILAVITLVSIGYERKQGSLATGTFVWSLLTAALLALVSFVIANSVAYEMWTTIALGAATVGFILLVYEKYN